MKPHYSNTDNPIDFPKSENNMNERIKQLWEQALEEFKAENKYATIIVPNPLQEKFAELIVQKCLDQLLVSDPTEDFDKGISWSVEQIKNHFGVEE